MGVAFGVKPRPHCLDGTWVRRLATSTTLLTHYMRSRVMTWQEELEGWYDQVVEGLEAYKRLVGDLDNIKTVGARYPTHPHRPPVPTCPIHRHMTYLYVAMQAARRRPRPHPRR